MEEIVRQTALIDWFRFTCPWDLDPDGPDGDSLTLLSLLRVDPGKVTVPRTNLLGRLNYARTVVYGEDVGVGLDPSESARMRGIRSQFIVDLPGSACRHFEARGGSWKDLISYLCSVPGVRFNRVDLALDDIDGELDVESLGFVEMTLAAAKGRVDVDVYGPSGVTDHSSVIAEDLLEILKSHGLPGRNVRVLEEKRPLTLTEVFPDLFEGKRSINVKI